MIFHQASVRGSKCAAVLAAGRNDGHDLTTATRPKGLRTWPLWY